MKQKKMKLTKTDKSSQELEPLRAKHCLQITFPGKFSIKQELSFIDYIADARNIFFSKDLYAAFKDVETAVALAEKSYLNKVPFGLIHSITRLGPAYCSFKTRTDEPTILTIRKLAMGTTHQCLAVRFPDAVDISIKKSMAKLKFSTKEDCQKAYLEFREVVWPEGQQPVVKRLSSESSPEQRQKPHHLHDEFAEDPKVLHIRLLQNFCLKKHIALLDYLNSASDIFLSEQCKVIFDDSKEILKRREVLRDLSIMGGMLTITPYFDARNQGDKKRALTEPPSKPDNQKVEETGNGKKKKRRLEASSS